MGRKPGVPQLYQPRGTTIWWCRFTVNGTRYRKSTGTRDHAKASAEAQRLHGEALLGRQSARKQRVPSTCATGPLALLFAEYIEWTRACGKAPSYIVKQEMHYRAHFQDHWTKLEQITGKSIEGYKVARVTNPERTTSVYKELVTLSRFLRWCKKQGLIDSLPEFDRFKPVTDYVPLDMTRKEVKRLLAAMPDRRTHHNRRAVREFFTVQWAQAMRPGEVMKLRWHDVDLEKRRVTIRQLADKTRDKDGRTIGMASEAHAVFASMAKSVAHLPTSFIFGKCTFRESLRIAARKVGVSDEITPHHLRHARISELAGSTRDVAAVQFFAGHKNLSTTDRYVRSRTERTEMMLWELEGDAVASKKKRNSGTTETDRARKHANPGSIR